MSSTYTRAGSPFIWIRYKDERGKWKGKATGFRRGNLGDERQAKLVARRQTEKERERTPRHRSERWQAWVPRWIEDRYGASKGTTATVYRRYWRRLGVWLESVGIRAPAQLIYRHVQQYLDWREKSAGINTAVHELKFLGVVMNEAVKRGYALHNPCVRMGIKRAPAKEKSAWTDDEISRVAAAVKSAPLWMRATFVLGLYQAARLRQCAVPLGDIDIKRRRITYRVTKGDKPFTQPIDERAIPELAAIITERAGEKTLCEIPLLPSVEWRRFLDTLDLPHLSHHGLRVTWITRAAKSGKVTLSEAKRYCNHASTSVHQIYMKLNADDVADVPRMIDFPVV